MSQFDGEKFTNYSRKDGLAHDRIQAIHCDQDGILWFGTGGGVSRYDGKEFVNLSSRDGLVYNSVLAIHRDLDGVVWFGTEGGVSRYDGKVFVNLTVEDGLGHNAVRDICHSPNGVMWFGTEGGVSRYDGKTFANFTKKDGLAANWVNAIHCSSDGVIWLGTGNTSSTYERGGVCRYDERAFANFSTKDGLADDFVNVIYGDPDGILWFGTDGGVSRYDGEKFVNLTTEDGLANDTVAVIRGDQDGVIWFGTRGGGISRYDGKRFINFTTKDGLAHPSVWSICIDSNGGMWFGTDGRGVSYYDGVAWTSLDTRDGLAGDTVHSIYQDLDGFMWFGTAEGGVTRYLRNSVRPKIHIASVTTDQVHRDFSYIPAFTPGIRVMVEYNSIDFKTLPEKRQYRCRIREIDSDWRKPTKSDTFDYVFDEPGTYTFEVQAIDRDLNYSEPASVKLEVIPDPRNHRIIQLEAHIREQELAEMERIRQELEDARQIQQSLLPDKPPEVKGFEIAGTSRPAREVSGDFYSYLSLGDNTGIVLADVTGKSVKAAMVAALTNGTLNAEIKGRTELWNSPRKILCELNTGLRPHLIRGMYTAMSLSIIQPEKKKLIFSNAGMPYPILKRAREVWELEVNGMPLGLVEKAEYEDLSVDMEVGDMVIFCSDGVIEAENEAGEMYQTESLLEAVKQANVGISAQEMVDLIVKDVTAFVGDEEASDDITVVVLRRLASS